MYDFDAEPCEECGGSGCGADLLDCPCCAGLGTKPKGSVRLPLLDFIIMVEHDGHEYPYRITNEGDKYMQYSLTSRDVWIPDKQVTAWRALKLREIALPYAEARVFPRNIPHTEFCDDCKHMSLKEHEQNAARAARAPMPPHICSHYQFPVRHLGAHPKLPRPPWCDGAYEKEEL